MDIGAGDIHTLRREWAELCLQARTHWIQRPEVHLVHLFEAPASLQAYLITCCVQAPSWVLRIRRTLCAHFLPSLGFSSSIDIRMEGLQRWSKRLWLQIMHGYEVMIDTQTHRTEWVPGPTMSVMEMKFMGTEGNIIWSQDPTTSRKKDPFNVNIILQTPFFI